MALDIFQIPALQDNYIYVLKDPNSLEVVVIDPTLAAPVLEFLDQNNFSLKWILNTHHHWDHVGGNLELQQKTKAQIVGFAQDQNRIPGITLSLQEGDIFSFGGSSFRVLEVPGHTLGHIAFWLPQEKALFCGDTLFSLGCGRLFEGTPSQLWSSLLKIRALPDDTFVYCAHEYTLSNGKFALNLEPCNQELINYMKLIEEKREMGIPTVPSLLRIEKALNPFLKADSPVFQHLEPQGAVDIFRLLRSKKDEFRG
jgi:hydroxyacylglutathione hydrolase